MIDLKSLVISACEIAVTKLQIERNGNNTLIYNNFFCNKFVISARYKSITKVQTGGQYYVY